MVNRDLASLLNTLIHRALQRDDGIEETLSGEVQSVLDLCQRGMLMGKAFQEIILNLLHTTTHRDGIVGINAASQHVNECSHRIFNALNRNVAARGQEAEENVLRSSIRA